MQQTEWCKDCGQAPAVNKEGTCEWCEKLLEQMILNAVSNALAKSGGQTIAPAA
jgi:hypothetical protein